MKASEVKLLHFLRKSPQFMIPIYQRTYSWTLAECQQLWDDIIRTGYDDRISTHFVGSIVYIEQGLSQVSSQSPLLVIDGQQRLTTVSLILEALARQLPDGTEPIDGFSAKKLRSYYLLNPLEDGERSYKLLLTQLAINLDIHETQDPRKIAKDVTNLGRWGNGNVEVALESLEDIPYVMGLVRQALEKQMGNGEPGV